MQPQGEFPRMAPVSKLNEMYPVPMSQIETVFGDRLRVFFFRRTMILDGTTAVYDNFEREKISGLESARRISLDDLDSWGGHPRSHHLHQEALHRVRWLDPLDVDRGCTFHDRLNRLGNPRIESYQLTLDFTTQPKRRNQYAKPDQGRFLKVHPSSVPPAGP